MDNIIFDLIKKVADTDKKNLEQTALKLMEECGEVAEAVLSYTKAPVCGYKGKTKEDIAEECSDVIIVAYTLLACKLGISKYDIADTILKKLGKWQTKIEDDERGSL